MTTCLDATGTETFRRLVFDMIDSLTDIELIVATSHYPQRRVEIAPIRCLLRGIALSLDDSELKQIIVAYDEWKEADASVPH